MRGWGALILPAVGPTRRGPLQYRLGARLFSADICEEYLRAYATTYEDDLAALNSDGRLAPFSNERHARIQVCGEKAVLHHYIDLSETAQSVLNLKSESFDDVRQRAQSLYEHKHVQIAKYCADLVRSGLITARA